MKFIRLIPDGKQPAETGWQEKLYDEAEIRSWNGNRGVPCGPNGIVVRDYDGPGGLELAREEFRTRREFFKCLVKTPKGLHVYLQKPSFDVPNAVKLGEQPIDLRSDGGYVVGVGSVIRNRIYEYLDGYEFRTAEELPVFPEIWLPPKKEVITQAIEEDDTLRRISRARLWLATLEPAISGQGGHRTMFRACCKMFQMFELSVDQAWPLILEYNGRCLPPFDERALRHKITDASNAKGK